MPLRVMSEFTDDTIPVRELKKGQVARITESDQYSEYIGGIVVRYPASLRGITFPDAWDMVPQSDDFRVRVLSDGTKFEVFDNE